MGKLIGDFNARTGNLLSNLTSEICGDELITKHVDQVSDGRGKHLSDFVFAKQLVSLNGFCYRGKEFMSDFTCVANGGRSVVDYALVSLIYLDCVSNFSLLTENEISYHKPLVIELNISSSQNREANSTKSSAGSTR